MASVDYGELHLEAAYIEINWKTNVITAKGIFDKKGNYVGAPVYIDNGENETFYNDSIKYNTVTKQGIVWKMKNDQAKDQHLTGDLTRVDGTTKNVYVYEGQFCPCEDPNASTYVKAKKIKVIPGKRVVTGPFQLWIADLPTPLFLPFGLFPISQQRTSGVIIPYYGESVDRGFFLRNGGYYWAISNKMDLKLTGDVYTKGGWGVNSAFHYKDRYKFDGNLDLSYNKRINFIDEADNYEEQNDFWVTWRHKPKTRGGKRFSAEVEAGTSTYNSSNSMLTSNYLASNFKSSVSYYSKINKTPFSYGINLRHNQNVLTNIYNFTLPDVNVSMNRQYPFKKVRIKNSLLSGLVKTLNFSYRYDVRNEVSNAPVSTSYPFTVANIDSSKLDTLAVNKDNFQALMDRARFGMKHTIPISASMSVGPLKLNPSFSLTAYGYPKELSYQYSEVDTAVFVTTNTGLNHIYTYNASMSANTRIYAIYKMKGARQPAIRQIITPNISYTYKPDFGEDRFGYYDNVRINEDYDSSIVSRYNGFLFGTPSRGKQSSVGFSIQNVFEIRKNKRADPNDSTGVAHLDEDGRPLRDKPKKLLNNLNIGSSYNFAADSLRLAVFRLSTRADAEIRKIKLNMNFGATFDPYIYDSIGNGSVARVDRFAIDEGQGLAKLTNANFALSTNLNPNSFDRKYTKQQVTQDVDDDMIDFINENQDLYVDWNTPWQLQLGYNLVYRQTGFADPTITQSLTVSGNISLTEKWKIMASSGYDFVNKKLSYTTVNVMRDLNCWEMSFRWVPFGFRQSYTFDINIKSQILKDLKLSRKRHWIDRNF